MPQAYDENMDQRCLIWDRVDDRLDRLGNKITTDDRAKIEAAFAQRVPRTVD